MSELKISKEFLEENKSNLSQFMPKTRRRGPYSKQEKESRRNEVYRLHFDYGYSARKISELMKVNRNTINGDVSYWYSKIISNHNIFDPEMDILIRLKRFEVQRTRLRIQTDKTNEFQEKLSLERIILDIDSKVLQIYQKLGESTKRVMDAVTINLNHEMKKQKKDTRYMLLFDKIAVSERAKERIEQIIREDKASNHHH
ncbi:MAG: hypothetical protein HOD60_06165 [Candidatus Nitrosopelagicus sp.]|jgi:hypothetical protein|nr:hypothetical protein [Candidatus Nitrosopelagicus sp.]